MKYPNTKNVLMIITAIILVGAAFLFAEYRNKKSETATYTKEDISTDSPENMTVLDDTNWKNILLANENIGTGTAVKDLTKKEEKLEPIDIISRQFFAQYMELRQLGASGDKLSQQELIEKTINSIVLEQPKAYTADQLITKADSSSDAIKQYGNDIANIFSKFSIKSRNEGVIVRDFQLKDDPSILKELDPIAISYKNIFDALLKLPIPKSVESIHLDMVNAMSKSLYIVNSFKKTAVDPLSGVQGVSFYQTTRADLASSLLAVKKYVRSLNIIYKPNEPGYILIK